MDISSTPACDALAEVEEEYGIIVDFLDFLMDRYEMGATDHITDMSSSEQDRLIMLHLGIDYAAVQRERTAMLQAARKATLGGLEEFTA